MRKLLLIAGCFALATACSPLRATPRKEAVVAVPAVKNTPLNFKPVPPCPSNWSLTVWVKATEVQVEDIKTVSQSEAVYCTHFIGNNDSERTPETGVMVEVKTHNLSSELPKGEKSLTSEEAEAMVAEVEKRQLNAESEAEPVLQRLQEVGYEASLGPLG
jgi:hypothetical protein